ncbi:putative terminase subunit, partial [Escherichia coli PA24]|jgi:hypothetical protein
MLTT